jgi:hypothetical protein
LVVSHFLGFFKYLLSLCWFLCIWWNCHLFQTSQRNFHGERLLLADGFSVLIGWSVMALIPTRCSSETSMQLLQALQNGTLCSNNSRSWDGKSCQHPSLWGPGTAVGRALDLQITAITWVLGARRSPRMIPFLKEKGISAAHSVVQLALT